jgi:hypothetical protein
MSQHLSFTDLDTELTNALNEHDLVIALGQVGEPSYTTQEVGIHTFLAFFDALNDIKKEKNEESLYLNQVTLIDFGALTSTESITGKRFSSFFVNEAQFAVLQHQLRSLQG